MLSGEAPGKFTPIKPWETHSIASVADTPVFYELVDHLRGLITDDGKLIGSYQDRTRFGLLNTVLVYKCECGHENRLIKNWHGPTPRGAVSCSNCGSTIQIRVIADDFLIEKAMGLMKCEYLYSSMEHAFPLIHAFGKKADIGSTNNAIYGVK